MTNNQKPLTPTYQAQNTIPNQGYTQPQYGYGQQQVQQQGVYGTAYPNNGSYAHPNAQAYAAAQAKQKKKKGPAFWIAIIVAIIAIGVCVALVVSMMMPKESRRVGSLGQLEGKTAQEIQAEIDRVVSEGMFNISIASAVVFEDGQSEGELKIENVPGNRYLMQVDIARQDTNEIIYSSGILDPNSHIQFDKLSVDLPKGEYPCTATFHALDPETEEEIGVAAANINVLVAN